MGTTTDRDSPCLKEHRPDGQQKCHIVLPEEERAKGYVRPLRVEYRHVGIAGPRHPLVDLSPEDLERFRKIGYVKFEPYPNDGSHGSALGRYWTQGQLDSIDKGCKTTTRMPAACAETYARQPGFYGKTFCCACGDYFPVREDGEFIWLDDGTRVGT
jgi:hypothetical protein